MAEVVNHQQLLTLKIQSLIQGHTCGDCHGVNQIDQAGQLPSLIKAEAFQPLLLHWAASFRDLILGDDFE